MTNFILPLKSTIDKICVDMATMIDPTMGHANLDDSAVAAEMLASDQQVLVWQIATAEPYPVNPMYSVMFGVGAKTTVDPGNYDMMTIIDAVSGYIYPGEVFDIMDYSGALQPTEVVGKLFITASAMDPQQFDRESGVRMMTIIGKALRI